MSSDSAATPPAEHVLVDVVLPLPLDEAFTYEVPEEVRGDVRVGSRVLVPFGPRRMTGLVVGWAERPPASGRLKRIQDVLDDEPAFTGEMLRLTRWIADYYVCGWGEVVKAALPPGTDVESRWRVARTDTPADGRAVDAAAKAVLRHLEVHPETTVRGLRQHVRRAPLALLRRLERDGLVELTAETTAPQVRVKQEKHLRLAPAFRDPSSAQELAARLRGAKQTAVVETLVALAREGEQGPAQADVLARAGASSATLRSLVEKGVIEVFEEEVVRSPLDGLATPAEAPRYLPHGAQQQALEQIDAAIDAGRFQAFLLHGVTGSGKTEVYIAALKEVLARGRTGIILVPEIALTPQTVHRFRSHFGDQIAVLHSKMSLGERYDAWRHLRSGRYRVAIGPRSAVLAPLSDLGLIVVDEEHESSYKQFEPAPRYHARDVAVMRAHLNDAVCILGSATPSLESFANAESGKYTLLPMPERVPVAGGALAQLPEIQVVDLALEHKKHRLDGALSLPLREAIGVRLERREQVILLQNRRGYAPILECQSCGFVPTCFDCSVTLTFHKDKRHLRCHYCGRTQRPPERCPKCDAVDFSQLGAGTQRVEEELATVFPEARVLRMDLDTTTRKNAHHELLDRFGRGEADILLGTQMVAKGLDFSRVTLVGVVNADVGMLLPDFRSEERAFQLLTQVAGRAGRADLPGEVILQTRNVDSPVLRFACQHDYEAFARYVLEERWHLGYPPFGRVAGIEFRGPDERRVEEIARTWTGHLRSVAAGVDVLGPEPAFIGRVKRLYRLHTIVKAPRQLPMLELQGWMRQAASRFGSVPAEYHIAVDIDPVGLF